MPGPFTSPVASSTPFNNDTNGFTAEDVQAAIEEAKNTAPGTAARFAATFGFKGSASNKYLEFFQSISSDNVGFILADDAQVKALSVAVKNSTTATFTVYKNGTSIDTLSLSAQRIISETGISIAVSADDEISVKITSGSARDIIFNVFLQVEL